MCDMRRTFYYAYVQYVSHLDALYASYVCNNIDLLRAMRGDMYACMMLCMYVLAMHACSVSVCMYVRT